MHVVWNCSVKRERWWGGGGGGERERVRVFWGHFVKFDVSFYSTFYFSLYILLSSAIGYPGLNYKRELYCNSVCLT